MTANKKKISHLQKTLLLFETPFQFSDHSRLHKVAAEGQNQISISLKEVKQNAKGTKNGAVFDIFSTKTGLMQFQANKTY